MMGVLAIIAGGFAIWMGITGNIHQVLGVLIKGYTGGSNASGNPNTNGGSGSRNLIQ